MGKAVLDKHEGMIWGILSLSVIKPKEMSLGSGGGAAADTNINLRMISIYLVCNVDIRCTHLMNECKEKCPKTKLPIKLRKHVWRMFLEWPKIHLSKTVDCKYTKSHQLIN